MNERSKVVFYITPTLATWSRKQTFVATSFPSPFRFWTGLPCARLVRPSVRLHAWIASSGCSLNPISVYIFLKEKKTETQLKYRFSSVSFSFPYLKLN
jgi:hypothetical protein